MYQQANWITQITVGGRDLGRFKSFEGGDITANDAKYQNWDGEVVLGGRRTRNSGTAKKLYRELEHSLVHWLDQQAVNLPAEIIRIPVGDDGVPWGDPVVLRGRLASVVMPVHDQATDDGGELTLGFTLGTGMA